VKENTLKVFDKLEETVISAKLGEITVHPPDEPPLSRIRNRFRVNITVISQRSVKGQKQLYSLLRSVPDFRGINILFDIDATNET
jgi:primosomal protein N'